VLLAVNRVSVYLQTKEIDMIQAMGMMQLLKEELTNIRNSSEYWDTSVAKAFAATVDVNLQEAPEDKDENTRKRKRPRRFEDRPETDTVMSFLYIP